MQSVARHFLTTGRAGPLPSADALASPGSVLLRSHLGSRPAWWWLRDPVRVVETRQVAEVRACLREVEQAVDHGWVAAGFVAYEAAPAFDAAFRVHPPTGDRLVWFGIYRTVQPVEAPAAPSLSLPIDWRLGIDVAAYEAAMVRIKQCIAAGETYQVNYTLRLEAACRIPPWQVFRSLLSAQPNGYAALIDTGDSAVCSVSPELFFAWEDDRLRMRPMKGTVRRGVTNAQDACRADWLRQSEKNRAENVMIVDMVRNDLGRIAIPGSVRVPELFRIERYRTLFQMTSLVEARTRAPFRDVFGALFPCASITGAPKIRTMQLIAELERSPRGVYTGAIGILAPGRRAQFNVAIRTVYVDRHRARAVFGTGGGVVWDSDAKEEYRECATKALVLREPPPTLDLLETIRWDPKLGFFLLDEHLHRMVDSARYFDFAVEPDDLLRTLWSAVHSQPGQPLRLRLLLSPDGRPRVASAVPLPDAFQACPNRTSLVWQVALNRRPVDRRNRFLYHKTTRRDAYDQARRTHPEADDVLLWNDRRELTESTQANVVVRHGRRFLTPPVDSGLLAGTFRRHLLEQGRVEEAHLPVDALADADQVYLINSVRGWIRAEPIDKNNPGSAPCSQEGGEETRRASAGPSSWRQP